MERLLHWLGVSHGELGPGIKSFEDHLLVLLFLAGTGVSAAETCSWHPHAQANLISNHMQTLAVPVQYEGFRGKLIILQKDTYIFRKLKKGTYILCFFIFKVFFVINLSLLMS